MRSLIALGYNFHTLEEGEFVRGILTASGVGDAIAGFAQDAHLSPIVLAFVIAGLIRAAVGSATVAMTTAAGIVAPMPNVSPELLVLATGAGSVMLSHVNDSGFWLLVNQRIL